MNRWKIELCNCIGSHCGPIYRVSPRTRMTEFTPVNDVVYIGPT